MTNFVMILLGVIAVLVLLFLWQLNRAKNLKDKLALITEQYELLFSEFDKLKTTQKIKAKNEEEKNEKINDLHSGKLSADDILPKQ